MSKKLFGKYLKDRYENQITWYDNKSTRYKKLNYALQIPTIIIAPVVPIAAFLDLKWVTIILSVIISILIGMLNFGKFEEKWHNYRKTCEALKKEKHYFQHKVNEYKDAEDPEGLFVQRVESIISTEHTKWLAIETTKEKELK